MPILLEKNADTTIVKEGVKRRIIHTLGLMTAVIDFDNGPWAQSDPPHSHVHEQTTYIADGEIIFFCEGEPPQRLKTGDMFSVHSGKEHAIQLLSKTARLIDSFTPPREDFLGV